MMLMLLLSSSCGDRPDGVPSRGRMERILYDYHKAQAIVAMTADGEYINGEKVLLSVLDKHGLDSEMFDSAMVYYTEHSDQLLKIYQNIDKRLKAEDEEMQARVGSSEMTSVYSAGDTTNLWNGAALIVLRPQPLHCLEQFTLKADTSYHASDHFILNADIKFIKEDKSTSSILYMSLSMTTKDGKTYSQICEPRGNSIQRLELSQAGEEQIKEVSGFFYFKGEDNPTTKSMCIVNGISLIRMHIPEVTDSVAADSTATDSTVVDTNTERREENPSIPSVTLSDSVPSGRNLPVAPSNRKNEVEDIKIRRAPVNQLRPAPGQRRQSIQQGRGQNGTTGPVGSRPNRQRLQVAPQNQR